MPEVDVQILPIVVAAVVSMVLGAVWYSPLLFMKQWMKLSGKTSRDMSKDAGPKYLLTFIAALVFSFVLYHFAAYAQVDTNMEALQFAGWMWFGVVMVSALPFHLFNGWPWGLFWIFQGHQLVSLILMSLIFVNL